MDSGVQLTDRRQADRHSPLTHGILIARVRPGHPATIVNISAHGALIEIAHRLCPDRRVELHVETANERAAIQGRVLRCSVAAVLPSRMVYHGAIGFDAPLSWFTLRNYDGYLVLEARAVRSPVR